MTDTSTPSEHDPLADTLRRARSDVRPMSGDALVAAARGAKDARARRRRRAGGGVLGAVAAVLLVAVAAVALPDHSSTQVVKSGAPEHDLGVTANPVAGIVTVTPSTGLVDGQTVTVTARGFDAGTTVTFIECTPAYESAMSPSGPNSTAGSASHAGDPQSGSSGGSADGASTEPGWWCDGPPAPAGSHATATATAPSTTTPPVEGGGRATATTTMRVVTRLSGFVTYASPTGELTIHDKTSAGDLGTCTNPEADSSPPTAETHSRNSGESTAPLAGSGTDGSNSNAPNVANTDSLEEFMHLFPGPPGACVILAVGMTGGSQTVSSSRPLSFGETPKVPTSSAPSTSVPSPDPTGNCPYGPNGSVCSPAVDPPTSAPSMADCPADPPAPSPMNGDHTSPLLDFTPTSITICYLYVKEPSPPPVLVNDAATLKRIARTLNALDDVPDSNTTCTSESGDTIVYIARAGGKRTTIVAQFYGCGIVSNGTTIRLGAGSLR
jgi:hypothetical protein